ncbi:MAG: hypothetical protein H6Q36_252 [Chloroflexi bacterium]|nr:hypothetical protein [Chloroflexota bacterium]
MATMKPSSARPGPLAVHGFLAAMLLVAACSAPAAMVPGSPGATGGASISPAALPTGNPEVTPPTTTETDWGAIWDAVPPSFPVPQGAEPAEPNEAVSVAWTVSGRPASITETMVSALEAAGWSIEGASDPYEDGSQVIDAVRGAPECRAQVTVAPRGDEILVMVRYAAACPWQ